MIYVHDRSSELNFIKVLMSSFLSLGIIDMWRMSMNNLMIVFRNTMNNVGLYLEYKVQEDHPPT